MVYIYTLYIILFLVLYSRVKLVQGNLDLLGLSCNHTSDCPSGTECVAASATIPIQTCVKSPVCGGATPGNCPIFQGSGQLLCVWIETLDCTQSKNIECKKFFDKQGIYKCTSLDRCDILLGNNTCSTSCNVHGNPCNGRGSCRSDSPNTFNCACDNGWNGTLCNQVASGDCMNGSGQCGDYGKCTNSSCVCSDGWSGRQCEISPLNETKNVSKSNSSGNIDTKKIISDESNSQKLVYIGVSIGVLLVLILIAVFFVHRHNKKRKLAEQLALDDIITARYLDDVPSVETPKDKIATM